MIKQIGGYAVPTIRTINGSKFYVMPVIEDLSTDIDPKIQELIKDCLDKLKQSPHPITGVYERKMQNGDLAILVNRDPYDFFKRVGCISKVILFKKDGSVKVKDSSVIPRRFSEGDVKVYDEMKRVIKNGIAEFKKTITKVFSTNDKKLINVEQNIYTPNYLYRHQIGDNSFLSRTFSEGFGKLGDSSMASRVKKIEFKDSDGIKVEYSLMQEGNFFTKYDHEL